MTLLKEKIPLPPLPVQKQITSLVHLESRAREDVSGLLTLLREYRTRLIADVVTGKLDVREVAARLPDEIEETEPLDELEVQDWGEDADVEAEEIADVEETVDADE